MLLKHLENLEDHRRAQGRQYPLAEVVLVTILAVLGGAVSYREIHSFIKVRFVLLRNTLGLGWRKPISYTQLRLVIQGMDRESLEAVFRSYSAEVAEALPEKCEYLACDGKVLRGSFDHMEDQKAAELLSIFAVKEKLILAHKEIPDKTNEIPAFQELVKNIGLKNKLFTLDAMHTQKNAA